MAAGARTHARCIAVAYTVAAPAVVMACIVVAHIVVAYSLVIAMRARIYACTLGFVEHAYMAAHTCSRRC